MAEKSIVVIQTAFLGDLLLAIPLLKNIKKIFPKCNTTLVCREGFGDFLKELNLVDDFVEIKKGKGSSYARARSILNNKKHDLLFCPHESIRSFLFCRKINAENKVGFFRAWNFFVFNKRVKKDKNLPDALRQLSLLSLYSEEIKKNLASYSKENLIENIGPVPSWTSMQVEDLPLQAGHTGKSVCIFPGSAWKTKQWTRSGFIELCKEFVQKQWHVVLLGGTQEIKIGDEIAKEVSSVTNQIGKTSLIQTLKYIYSANLVISNDSASQHLAALVAKPTVSIFGPTVLALGFRPWNENIRIVQNDKLLCRPCGKHGHKKCPIKTHECMRSITVSQVLNAAGELVDL